MPKSVELEVDEIGGRLPDSFENNQVPEKGLYQRTKRYRERRLLTFHHLHITNVSRRVTGNADFAFNELLVEGKEVVVSRPSVRV
jgi:hypothetical protein